MERTITYKNNHWYVDKQAYMSYGSALWAMGVDDHDKVWVTMLSNTDEETTYKIVW